MKKMLAALCAAVMAACAMAAPVFAEGENEDIYNRDRMASDRDRGFKNALPVYALGDDLSLCFFVGVVAIFHNFFDPVKLSGKRWIVQLPRNS